MYRKNGSPKMKKLPLLALAALFVTTLFSQTGLMPLQNDEIIKLAKKYSNGTDYQSFFTPDSQFVVKFYTDDNEMRYFLVSSDFSQIRGYIGNTSLAVQIDSMAVITSVQIIKSQDTPFYVNKIKSAHFFMQFTGINSFDNIKTVTGATITSRAIIENLEATLNIFRSFLE